MMKNNAVCSAKVICWNLQRFFYSEPSKLSLNVGASHEQGVKNGSYQDKVRALAAGLKDICPDEPPALLAFCEVENESCIQDLMHACAWSKKMRFVKDHKIKHLQGLDTALLYRKDLFKQHYPRPCSHVIHNRFKTRDIFEVSLFCKVTQEPVTVILNHWPSRLWTGSQSLRIALGDYCSRLVNQRLKFDAEEFYSRNGKATLKPAKELLDKWNGKIIVMGDFNDEPYDKSIAYMMDSTRIKKKAMSPLSIPSDKSDKGVKAYLKQRPKLYNPCWKLLASESGQPKGTVYWSSKWYLLDQVLFSGQLLQSSKNNEGKKQLFYESGSLYIHTGQERQVLTGKHKFVSRNGYPRAFDAKRKRGISDHLPLVFNLAFA